MLTLLSIRDPHLPALLHSGSVGVLPADTIYGLAALAQNPDAVRHLYDLKGRQDQFKPGTVIAANIEQLIDLGVDEAVVRSVAHLWPNPLSIELPIGEELAYLYQDTGHRAFRVVADPGVRALLEQTGPLLTSSANRHGDQPAANLDEAKAYFGNDVDFYADGGDMSNRPPSTVARFVNGKLEVVRPGAVIIDEKGNIA
ncbi:MAG TPA: L-threonylcarbamoyladenylate synthase [Patescibacteria group bacterium]|nr:L-threonylcarbamoyladenylate synthase [Patescibacteria group bacterium]